MAPWPNLPLAHQACSIKANGEDRCRPRGPRRFEMGRQSLRGLLIPPDLLRSRSNAEVGEGCDRGRLIGGDFGRSPSCDPTALGRVATRPPDKGRHVDVRGRSCRPRRRQVSLTLGLRATNGSWPCDLWRRGRECYGVAAEDY